jgi:hypothetical protein
MSKVVGYKREDGKWVNPPTYSPASLDPIIHAQHLSNEKGDKRSTADTPMTKRKAWASSTNIFINVIFSQVFQTSDNASFSYFVGKGISTVFHGHGWLRIAIDWIPNDAADHVGLTTFSRTLDEPVINQPNVSQPDGT